MKTKCILIIVATLLAAPVARAFSTIGWQNVPGDPLIDSQGNALDATYVFELGTFATGFTPTAGNTNLWAANWKLLNRATAPPDINTGNGWNVGGSFFSSSLDFNANGTVQGLSGSATFTAGEQAYIWVYSTTNNGELALVKDDVAGSGPDDIWQLPDPTVGPGTTLTWVLDDTTPVAVVGNLSGTFNGDAFRLQTAQVSPIPEPGSSLMILLVGCLARVVRSRQRR